eukprot:767059-Hanusia_phi.AAC.4
MMTKRFRRKELEAVNTEISAKKQEYQSKVHLVWQTMKDLATVQSNFPEVAMEVRSVLHPDLLVLWDPARDISNFFDHHEMIRTNSAHQVLKCRKGSEQFAVKKYHVADNMEALKTCFREAALLCRLKHPAIVEVVAMFEDADDKSVCIQMPFYEHGQIDQWIEACLPRWDEVRRVLLQVSEAISFLHDSHIVHGDIKPANILIGSDQRGRLTDYDISVDLSTRTSSMYAAKSHRYGHTAGFEAPELMATGNTYQTDLWSFGATIKFPVIRDSCCRGDGRQDTDVNNLIACLQRHNPQDRITASMMKKHAFFNAILKPNRHESVRECSIAGSEGCRNKCLVHEGVECRAQHFTCRECLIAYTECEMNQDLRRVKAREGRIKCPSCADVFSHAELARCLPGDMFQSYLQVTLKIAEEQMVVALEDDMQARWKAEMEKLRRMDALEREVHMCAHEIEELLVTRKDDAMICHRARGARLPFTTLTAALPSSVAGVPAASVPGNGGQRVRDLIACSGVSRTAARTHTATSATVAAR